MSIQKNVENIFFNDAGREKYDEDIFPPLKSWNNVSGL